jgi:transglutaminase-like putative cysteine protease
MSFGREKRLLLGFLAGLAPLPLPFNEVVSWFALCLYWLAIGLFLWRVSSESSSPLPAWAMNVLGLAYLPVLFVDFLVLWQGRLLRPLVHLALFALAVKLFGMKLEKDKWHILLLIFFVFVAAMGSSVHPAVVFYLVAFLGVAIMVLARFASFHVLGSYGLAGRAQTPIPLRGFILTATLLTIAGAIPLFAFLPRLGSPYVTGPGGSSGPMIGGAGLMDFVTLDVVGRVRTSRAVAMRVSYETPPPAGHEMRFRAGVYSQFKKNGWARTQRRTRAVRRERDGFFHVAPGLPRSWAEIWLEPVVSTGLVLPIEAVTVNLPATTLHLDQEGLVSVPQGRGRMLNYRTGMPEGSGLRLEEAAFEDIPAVQPDDLLGVSDQIEGLAKEVGGIGSAWQQAQRIEEYLSRNFTYTLDLVGSQTENPVEEFLFRTRRGHCEYFASSMVLMLRSRGIPARFTTGYLGGDYSPFEGYFVVRQSDAHAWVEAYLPEEGWVTFDPTPPAGRPSTRSSGWYHLFSQAYDYAIFRWDRYVLTYGFFDQVGIARRLVTWWSDWWRSRSSPDASTEETIEVAGEDDAAESAGDQGFNMSGYELIPLSLALLWGAWWIWRHRPAFSAVRAYRQLRSRIENDEAIELQGSTPPLGLAEHIASAKPLASVPARRVIDLYLRESFGGQELTEEERQELRIALRDAVQNLRKSA